MWVLSSEGDFLQGRRIWLKPGKKYLFGRVQNDGVCHAIDHKSISRQHLVIEVGHVQQGDGTQIHARSKLVLSDQSSKGTTIDGESIHGRSQELGDRDNYSIKLGRYPRALRITWIPVVLSFSFPSKELRARDPLAHARARLEDLDIKTVLPYITGQTTHVVQSKRNTSKGLQALVTGKYIVQKSYIEAIVYAATPSDLENEESLSPLEEDFDAFWPAPDPHLPPQGREPTELADSAYKPDTGRSYVFEGYTFVFCDSGRFEELQGPITSGHGKALLYEVEPGKTTAEDIIEFVKQAAGNKGFAYEYDGTGGVIVVQFQMDKNQEDWSRSVQARVSQLSGQKIIEPSEFLDAILQNNASKLCQAAPKGRTSSEDIPDRPADRGNEVQGGTQSSRVRTSGQQSEEVDLSADDPASVHVNNTGLADTGPSSRSTKRSKSTRPYVPKFKTFDDGFDMDSIPAYTLAEGDGVPAEEATQAFTADSLAGESQPNQTASNQDDMVEELLPGAAAMKHHLGGKRRREPTPPSEPQTRPKRPKLDVKEAARQRREAEDEAAMARRQEDVVSFQAMAEGMDLAQLQSLAIIEEMPVHTKERQSRSGVSDDLRWDEKWNGRKDFKKFRRKGHADGPAQHRIQTVIVPLEEVKRNEYALGDANMPTAGTRPETRDASGPATQTSQTSQSASQSVAPNSASRTQKRPRETEDSDDDGLRFRFRRKKR